MATSNDDGDARTQALQLMKRKDAMQKELDELHAGLQEQNADLGQGSLFDNEGFPRADIDVYNVRLTRVRVIELRNDVKDLSEQIRKLLEVALARPSVPEKPAAADEQVQSKPFALVNGVAPGSPAATAGLQRGDRIVRFGSVNASNHDNLKAVAMEVFKNQNRNVTLSVMRKDSTAIEQEIGLVLTPKAWSGRGLLGCHVVPL